ncbi:MAG: dockerin type I repeat-containing protein [Clostridia bacterium]|nr:dockerin type I repeat-containing protein [Clostridia bacterium]
METKKMTKKRFFKKTALLLLAIAAIITAGVIPMSKKTIKADAAEYPYPNLLDYTDLEKSFKSLAESTILPKYRDCVLESIKYHIESDTKNYRIAKCLMKAINPTRDGHVVFFFDGCSTNLEGAVPCFSGFSKDGHRYNQSAVCIVLQVNGDNRPEIVFASCNGSTSPDNVRNAAKNGGNPPGSLRDGVYYFQTIDHGNYAGFNVITTTNSHVRACTYLPSYISQASGINIHRKYYSHDYITDDTTNSTGCFNIGRNVNNMTEYNNFVECITGYKNGGYTNNGYVQYKMMGVIVVDRSNYKTWLATIYGNDSDFGIEKGWTGEKIAAEITVGSDLWNETVNDRIGGPEPEKGDVDGNGKIDSTDYISMKRHILNISKLAGKYFKAGDMDGNGKIDSTDTILLKRRMLGIS